MSILLQPYTDTLEKTPAAGSRHHVLGKVVTRTADSLSSNDEPFMTVAKPVLWTTVMGSS